MEISIGLFTDLAKYIRLIDILVIKTVIYPLMQIHWMRAARRYNLRVARVAADRF